MISSNRQSGMFIGGSCAAAVIAAIASPDAEAGVFPYETSFEQPTFQVGDVITARADGVDGSGPDDWRTDEATDEQGRRIVQGGVDGAPAAVNGTQMLFLEGSTATESAYYNFSADPIPEPFTVEAVMARSTSDNAQMELQINPSDRGQSFDGVRVGFNSDGVLFHDSSKSTTPFDDLVFDFDPSTPGVIDPVPANTFIRFVIDVDPAADSPLGGALYDLTLFNAATGELIGQGTDLPSRGNTRDFRSIRFSFGSGSTGQEFGLYVDSISIVPEPASLALLGLSGAVLWSRRRT